MFVEIHWELVNEPHKKTPNAFGPNSVVHIVYGWFFKSVMGVITKSYECIKCIIETQDCAM